MIGLDLRKNLDLGVGYVVDLVYELDVPVEIVLLCCLVVTESAGVPHSLVCALHVSLEVTGLRGLVVAVSARVLDSLVY